ncbi:MAG: hypothetical protein RL095_3970 [Verrucomicrobiota bacterium]|jgi:hypothetical protein
MSTLVCFVEGKAEKILLDTLLPKLLPAGVSHQVIPFEGKQDLEKQLERKMRGWLTPDSRFLVLRDKDQGDCTVLKQRLMEKCRASGQTKFLVRIACHEMESFYLGDLAAVEAGLQKTGLQKQQLGRKFRDPDALGNAKQELERLTKDAYEEIAGSRVIAPHLKLDGQNASTSFRHLLSGIAKLTAS